jgi:hypothetical protein
MATEASQDATQYPGHGHPSFPVREVGRAPPYLTCYLPLSHYKWVGMSTVTSNGELAPNWEALSVTGLVTYSLRDANRHDQLYGEEISDEEAAFQRAQQVADFYGHPIEVCRVTFGHFLRVVGSPVQPSPTARPSPLVEGRDH